MRNADSECPREPLYGYFIFQVQEAGDLVDVTRSLTGIIRRICVIHRRYCMVMSYMEGRFKVESSVRARRNSDVNMIIIVMS